jgi:hypothetical protein
LRRREAFDAHVAPLVTASSSGEGTLPPTENDSQGNPLGFWSITVYQPDPTGLGTPAFHTISGIRGSRHCKNQADCVRKSDRADSRVSSDAVEVGMMYIAGHDRSQLLQYRGDLAAAAPEAGLQNDR